SSVHPPAAPPPLPPFPTRRSSDLAGAAWAGDSVSCPRTGEPVTRSVDEAGVAHWRVSAPLPDGREFARPEPDWWVDDDAIHGPRSEEHTSELQSRFDLVCRPLLEK